MNIEFDTDIIYQGAYITVNGDEGQSIGDYYSLDDLIYLHDQLEDVMIELDRIGD